MRLLQLTYLVVFVSFVTENDVFEAGSVVFAHPFAAIDSAVIVDFVE